jgi:F-type H+-transporting ATPase subunit b
MKTAITNAIAIAGICIISMRSVAFAAGGGEATGLPQLDITTWPNQLLWLVVTFAIGYFLMARLIAPRIGNVLEQRQRTINDDLQKAKQAEAEAATMQADYQASLEDARNQATAAASKAMAEAKASGESAEADLTAKLAKKTKAAENRLSKMRDDALANINDVATEVAQDAVKAVTGLKITKADASKSVKKIVKSAAGQEA